MNWDKFAVFIGVLMGAGIVLFTLWLFKPDAMNAKPITIYNELGLVEVLRQDVKSTGDPILMYRPMPGPGGNHE